MNVFELDQALVNDYERFARSFTLNRAPDIRQQVEELYASDRFWPEPLISINPRYELGHRSTSWSQAGRFMKPQQKYSALIASYRAMDTCISITS
jgi:hypothetical protein